MDIFSNHWWSDSIMAFMDTGGNVLWIILVVTLMTWTFIIERFWYIYLVYPQELKLILEQWQQRADNVSWSAHKIRLMNISLISTKLNQHQLAIQTFVVILPILGLLGTVVGMINTFEVLAIFGTGNARALAGSISTALITTMAGLMSSIPCLIISSMLTHRTQREISQLSDQLVIHHRPL